MFGDNSFGRRILLATKLVEAGVPSVQIELGGWDMHGDITDGMRALVPTFDAGFGGLMRFLRETGLISKVTVLCLSEFGRTPRINQGRGRDHWSGPVSVIIGGAGIAGGQSFGTVDPDGEQVLSNPVSVGELYATALTAMGLDLDRDIDLHDNLGRRYYITGENGEATPIRGLQSNAQEY
jgi:uncharacterized protein (DUF1501 family)